MVLLIQTIIWSFRFISAICITVFWFCCHVRENSPFYRVVYLLYLYCGWSHWAVFHLLSLFLKSHFSCSWCCHFSFHGVYIYLYCLLVLLSTNLTVLSVSFGVFIFLGVFLGFCFSYICQSFVGTFNCFL